MPGPATSGITATFQIAEISTGAARHGVERWCLSAVTLSLTVLIAIVALD